jgi:hypothetical protein
MSCEFNSEAEDEQTEAMTGSNLEQSLSIQFNLPNPSSRTIALGFTERLIEMSTRRSFWG